MYILASACKDASFMTVMLFIKKLVDIIFIIAPILLILLLTIDFSKAVMANDETRIKQLKDVSIKRILFAIVLLFVPLIVDTSFSLLPENKSKVIDCYNNASQSNVDKLVEKANAKKAKEEKKAEQRLKKLRKKQEAEAKKRAKNAEEARKKAQQQNNSRGATPLVRRSICTNCSWSEKIAQTAEVLAWPEGTDLSVYKYTYGRNKIFYSWSELTGPKPTQAFMDAYDKVRPNHFNINEKYPATRVGASCDVFAATVARASGYDLNIPFGLAGQNPYLKESKKWTLVSTPKRGDFCNMDGHSQIYLGNNKIAQGGYPHYFGFVTNDDCGNMRIYRAS